MPRRPRRRSLPTLAVAAVVAVAPGLVAATGIVGAAHGVVRADEGELATPTDEGELVTPSDDGQDTNDAADVVRHVHGVAQALDLEVPATLAAQAAAADTPTAVAATHDEARRHLEALASIAVLTSAVAAPVGPFAWVGRLGETDPAAALDAARDAYEAGRLGSVGREAAEGRRVVDGAATRGRRRLALAGSVLVVVAVGGLVVRREMHGRRARGRRTGDDDDESEDGGGDGGSRRPEPPTAPSAPDDWGLLAPQGGDGPSIADLAPRSVDPRPATTDAATNGPHP